MRLQVIYPPSGPHDAIAAHARLMAIQLRAAGAEASYAMGGTKRLFRAVFARCDDWVLLQYNPYSFGRWGFAPQLVLAVLAARLVPGSPRVAVMVHEAYSPEQSSIRNRIMGEWQREQFRLIMALASCILASTESNCTVIRRLVPTRRATHLPISSTIPYEAHNRELARRALGVTDDDLVVTTFGGRHPTRELAHVEAALQLLAGSAGIRPVLLNLGADPPDILLPKGVRAITPGPLDPSELSRQLTVTDICLLPFSDGVSMRRTTLAAALAHGLPVLATEGPATEQLLRDAPDALALSPTDDQERFARSALDLADDPGRRSRMRNAARVFYTEEMDWPVTCERVITVLSNC